MGDDEWEDTVAEWIDKCNLQKCACRSVPANANCIFNLVNLVMDGIELWIFGTRNPIRHSLVDSINVYFRSFHRKLAASACRAHLAQRNLLLFSSFSAIRTGQTL